MWIKLINLIDFTNGEAHQVMFLHQALSLKYEVEKKLRRLWHVQDNALKFAFLFVVELVYIKRESV